MCVRVCRGDRGGEQVTLCLSYLWGVSDVLFAPVCCLLNFFLPLSPSLNPRALGTTDLQREDDHSDTLATE